MAGSPQSINMDTDSEQPHTAATIYPNKCSSKDNLYDMHAQVKVWEGNSITTISTDTQYCARSTLTHTTSVRLISKTCTSKQNSYCKDLKYYISITILTVYFI
jgi:hypothetical protein